MWSVVLTYLRGVFRHKHGWLAQLNLGGGLGERRVTKVMEGGFIKKKGDLIAQGKLSKKGRLLKKTRP